MNEETQILLKELVESVKNIEGLVEAVNKPSSPDWWMVALTAISTIAVIAIAFVQIRIQRQQTKAQEFAIYKPMFAVIEDTNEITSVLLNKIYNYFSDPVYRVIDEKFLYRLKEYYIELEKRLKDSRHDFKLKLPNGSYNVDTYLKLITYSIDMMQLFYSMDIDGDIILIEEDKRNKSEKTTDEIVDAIIDRISNDGLKVAVRNILNEFLEIKKETMALNIVGKIKDNC